MSINLIVNGSNYAFPQDGEENWGDGVTAWAAAVTSGMLQKAGGAFTLLAEVNFGDNFALKGQYFKFTSGVAGDGKQIELKAPDSPISASYALVLPAAEGQQYDLLKFSASGVLSVGKIENSNIADDTIEFNKLKATTENRVIVSGAEGILGVSDITDTELAALDGIEVNIAETLDGMAEDLTNLGNLASETASDLETLDAAAVKITGDQSVAGTKDFTTGVKTKIAFTAALAVVASAIDWAAGSVFYKDISGDTTFTFSNTLEGQTITLMVENTTGGSKSLTFPANVRFAYGTNATSIPDGKRSLFTFIRIGDSIFGAELSPYEIYEA